MLKFLEDEARKDPATYKDKFFKEFGYFLKARVCDRLRACLGGWLVGVNGLAHVCVVSCLCSDAWCRLK